MMTTDESQPTAAGPDAGRRGVLDAEPQARAALEAEVGAGSVGDPIGAYVEDEYVATYRFTATMAGYPGWHWAVTMAEPAPGDQSTRPEESGVSVDEIVLLPGERAIVAPEWVPWRDRIQPGDLSPGDLLPIEEDDSRLVPAYLAGDDVVDRTFAKLVADEVGLGRQRVLSLEGREAAAGRWYAGDPGPDVPLAQSAPARCSSCGFLVRLEGPLSDRFGVCANEHANDDGRVVAYEHGCGAHSGAQLRRKQLPQPPPDPVYDTLSRDDLEDF